MKTTYKGIDYGHGLANIDKENGIRFGVLPFHEITQQWCDSSEGHYSRNCPHCGYSLSKEDIAPCECPSCEAEIEDGTEYADEADFHFYKSEGYKAFQDSDSADIFIEKSPYFTKAQFCSPCAPGACYILNSCEDGERAYCFGHDWFEGGKAPYPVYSVETGELVDF